MPSDKKGRMCKHLQTEGRGCNYLLLWLDCDREGENICFEVMDQCLPVMAGSKTDRSKVPFRENGLRGFD